MSDYRNRTLTGGCYRPWMLPSVCRHVGSCRSPHHVLGSSWLHGQRRYIDPAAIVFRPRPGAISLLDQRTRRERALAQGFDAVWAPDGRSQDLMAVEWRDG